MKPRDWWLKRVKRLGLLTAIGVAVLGVWVSTKLWGMLALSIVLYLCVPALLGTKPWGLSELLEWAGQQPPEAWVATVAIFAAYAFAVQTWRFQKRTELGLAAAADLGKFTEEVQEDLLDVQIFVEKLVELHVALLSAPLEQDFEFEARYVRDQLPAINEAIRRLRAAARRVYLIRTRHGLVFDVGFTVSTAIREVEKAMEEVNRAIPRLPLPASTTDAFLEKISIADETAWRGFVVISDRSYDCLSLNSGKVSGFFAGAIFYPSLAGFLRFFVTSKAVFGLLDKPERGGKVRQSPVRSHRDT